jgi:histidinol-phosphate/aromatic aminotransferase/cobyric acid decarboxylase-like protein
VWACTGIRLGSVIAPTPAHMTAIKSKQVPWSVNCMALAFLSAAVQDKQYLETMWEQTPQFRRFQVEEIGRHFPSWRCIGESFLSWVWIEMPDEMVAERAVAVAKLNGTPVRWGKPGYRLPKIIRIAVRNPELTTHLLNAWKKEFAQVASPINVDAVCDTIAVVS